MGAVQRRYHASLPLEALPRLGRVGEMLRQNVDRHGAVEPRVAGATRISPAAGPDRHVDLVATKSCTRRQGNAGTLAELPPVARDAFRSLLSWAHRGKPMHGPRLSLVAALCAGLAGLTVPALAQKPAPLSDDVRRFVTVDATRVVLAHVRVIDGKGNPAAEDRNVVLEDGRIVSIGPGADVAETPGQRVLDLHGHTVLPGLVGMHDHLYHIARPNLRADGTAEPLILVPQMTFSAPRLYLAGGVTTIRTAGSVEPYADLNVKRAIDEGRMAGPRVEVTGPYLEGAGSPFIQMYNLSGPEDARRFVDYWADLGATSFKAYTNITRTELEAAIKAAHARGLKVTGHLCSVTYPEAADLGIDNLEHGFFVDTELDPDKRPDACPKEQGRPTLKAMDPGGEAARKLIAKLVARRVAITSTLPVFEHGVPNRPPLRPEVLEALSPQARESFLISRARRAAASPDVPLADFRRAMALERAFAEAGGLLVAGCDPTGNGGTLPGFGDQREVELLVEAGFSPVEAIRIASYNGAVLLGKADRIGSIAPGLLADLLVVKGDPSTRIEEIEKPVLVFKDGVGYDPAKLLESVRGRYGQY